MPTLKLYLLNGFSAELDGKPLTAFRSDRVRALLAYLAVEGQRPHPRSHLAELLWSGYAPVSARTSLRVALSNLRQVLSPLNLLQVSFRTLLLHTNHPYFWCDALALEAEGNGEPATGEAWLLQARPELFLAGLEGIDSGPFQVWLRERRAYYRELITRRQTQGVLPAPPPPDPVMPSGTAEPAPAGEPGETLAPTVEAFYGRHNELDQLRRWILATSSRRWSTALVRSQGNKRGAQEHNPPVGRRCSAPWPEFSGARC
ncbi:MAG: hypothetical protein DCC55_25310 [Chloroflexi bacterium]|nr:MAG: hypothetical protein DCC55_25310 [Chloroflexota bacterium]